LVAKGRLWIRHRTATHWGICWLSLLAYAYYSLPLHHWAAPLLGFAAGGVVHLFIDSPNPMGVSWIFERRSLNLWASGEKDYVVISAAWIAVVAVFDSEVLRRMELLRGLDSLGSCFRGIIDCGQLGKNWRHFRIHSPARAS